MYNIYLKHQALNTVTIRDGIVHGLCRDQPSSGTEARLMDNKNEGAKVYHGQPKLLDCIDVLENQSRQDIAVSLDTTLKIFLDRCWPILVNYIWTLMLEAWSRIFCYDLSYVCSKLIHRMFSFYQTLCYMDINKTKNNFKFNNVTIIKK